MTAAQSQAHIARGAAQIVDARARCVAACDELDLAFDDFPVAGHRAVNHVIEHPRHPMVESERLHGMICCFVNGVPGHVTVCRDLRFALSALFGCHAAWFVRMVCVKTGRCVKIGWRSVTIRGKHSGGMEPRPYKLVQRVLNFGHAIVFLISKFEFRIFFSLSFAGNRIISYS